MKRLHFVLIFILDIYTEWLFGYLVPNLIHSFVPVFHSPHRQLLNEGARRRKRETRGCQAGFLFV